MLSAFVELAGDAEVFADRKDPDLRAFCYVRVIEIPTPRWTACDAKWFGIEMEEGVPMTMQERDELLA